MNKTSILLIILLITGCHSASITKFNSSTYTPTTEVKVFTDLTTIQKEYVEIGYVEAKGGVTISKQTLLDDMIKEAMKNGADALIKVEFYDRKYNNNDDTFYKPASKAVMIKFKN